MFIIIIDLRFYFSNLIKFRFVISIFVKDRIVSYIDWVFFNKFENSFKVLLFKILKFNYFGVFFFKMVYKICLISFFFMNLLKNDNIYLE